MRPAGGFRGACWTAARGICEHGGMNVVSRVAAAVAVIAVVLLFASLPASGQSVAGGDLEAVRGLIKPSPGESPWMEIPWLTSVWEARKKAAAEGKPMFIWAGSGGGPIGVC